MWGLQSGDRGKYVIVQRMEGAVANVFVVSDQSQVDATIKQWGPEYTYDVYLGYELKEAK